ncbi:MAG: AAA family ATPase [Dehalogenimonas sp.]
MSLPQITETIGGYDYDWTQEQVRIECRRLKFSGDDLKGEMTVSSTSPAVSANHIHRSTFNFSSDVARTRMIKALSEKTSGLDLDWSGILEQTCYYTLGRQRRGESAVEIDSSQSDIQPPEYLLHPFLIKNYPSIFFGDPSSGKSLVSHLVSATLTLPWKGNPMKWQAPKEPHRVLFLDWETDRSTVSWTSKCIEQGMNTGPLYLHYRRCGRPLCDDVEQIAEWIVETGADVTILDSLGMAVGGDLNATEPALNFWTAWRQLKTTSLILAHVKKDQGDGAKRTVYGNQYYTAEARCIWEVKKIQEAGEDQLDIALFHRKPPPFAKLHQPLGLHFDFGKIDANGISQEIKAEFRKPESVAGFVQAMGAKPRILALLKEGALSQEEIVKTLSLTSTNTYSTLSRLKSSGEVVKLPEKRWGLTYNG